MCDSEKGGIQWSYCEKKQLNLVAVSLTSQGGPEFDSNQNDPVQTGFQGLFYSFCVST